MTLVLEEVGGQEGERRSARGEVGVEWVADILEGEVVVEDDEGVLGGRGRPEALPGSATREHGLSLALIAECDTVRWTSGHVHAADFCSVLWRSCSCVISAGILISKPKKRDVGNRNPLPDSSNQKPKPLLLANRKKSPNSKLLNHDNKEPPLIKSSAHPN